MDYASLVPVPDVMPVNWIWLQLLLTLTTFLHLVAMNIMLGTGVIAFANLHRQDNTAQPLCRQIAKTIPFAIAMTVNLGVAPLLFLQVLYGQFFYTSSVLMGVYWLAVVGVLIIAYYSAYIFNLRQERPADGKAFIGVAVVLLAVVGFIFANNVSLMQMPESWAAYFEARDGRLLNFSDRALIPRYLHFIASAVAVGGLAVALYYEFRKRAGDSGAGRWIRQGCNWFTIATIVNYPIGFWFLGMLPEPIRDPAAMGNRLFFFMVIISTFAGIKAVIHSQLSRVFPAVGWTLASILFMTIARDLARVAYLRPYVNLADLPVTPQYSPFILFLIFLAGGLCLVYWMLKTVFSAKEVQS